MIKMYVSENNPSWLFTHWFIYVICSCSDYKLRTITTSSQEHIEIASLRVYSYSQFFQLIQLGEPAMVVTTIFDILIHYLLTSTVTIEIASEIVRLFSEMCKNMYIQQILLNQESVRQVIITHYTLRFPIISQPKSGRILTTFYTFLTELLLVKAVPGDLDQYVKPLIDQLQQFQNNPSLSVEEFCVCLRRITGVLRACQQPHQFDTVFCMM